MAKRILPSVFADTCHKTKLAESILCPKFTKIAGHCIVDKDTAFGICAKTPGCKYVLTTSNGAWNMAFQNAAMLGKDPLSYNSQWTSCELPATTDAKIFNERGSGGGRGGDSISTTKLRHPKMMRATEEVKLPHAHLLLAILFACAHWEMLVVKIASKCKCSMSIALLESVANVFCGEVMRPLFLQTGVE